MQRWMRYPAAIPTSNRLDDLRCCCHSHLEQGGRLLYNAAANPTSSRVDDRFMVLPLFPPRAGWTTPLRCCRYCHLEQGGVLLCDTACGVQYPLLFLLLRVDGYSILPNTQTTCYFRFSLPLFWVSEPCPVCRRHFY